jgi:4-amino-4-deoxy-L-arabinose transferase-like glycosyltransferase
MGLRQRGIQCQGLHRKFQADMGILLAFMFLVNMLGAILLLPALAAFLVGERLRAPTQTRASPG